MLKNSLTLATLVTLTTPMKQIFNFEFIIWFVKNSSNTLGWYYFHVEWASRCTYWKWFPWKFWKTQDSYCKVKDFGEQHWLIRKFCLLRTKPTCSICEKLLIFPIVKTLKIFQESSSWCDIFIAIFNSVIYNSFIFLLCLKSNSY